MATLSKEFADRLVAGEFPEDGIVRIVKYTNVWGGEAYGCTFRGELDHDRYLRETEFVRNPSIYWENPKFIKQELE